MESTKERQKYEVFEIKGSISTDGISSIRRDKRTRGQETIKKILIGFLTNL